MDGAEPDSKSATAVLMADMGRRAKAAARVLAVATTAAKNAALIAAAAAIRAHTAAIKAANVTDVTAGQAKGLSAALLDRLELTDSRIKAMAQGLEDIAALPDPVGTTLAEWTRPNGLKISRVRTPLGVIGVIYESRPNVTADAGGLSIKAGNVCILRGGSESLNSSRAIQACLRQGLEAAGLPVDAIQMVPTADRAAVGEMLTMTRYIDVIVPRGGASLVERIMRDSRVPTFQHLIGLCHTYIHAAADPDKARHIVLNAKMRRTGVCGATETLLVDAAVAAKLLPPILDDLIAAGCEIRGDEAVQKLDGRAKPAVPSDWDTEYLDAILSVKVVANLDAAIAHITAHGSEHTEAIITEDTAAAERFMDALDSAIVLHNASTQFADGGEFGMGAEIGIATGKLHARGPVGVEQLTTFKYKVRGTGQVRP
ncbi:MAG: glutamate-5-semialdehyde dehydrogenase [Rhodospirillaceae bacterium]|nr:MAG: glutamate-5-semialdehyde dehydrogenase [Rhodospirillaceae bacterium]